MQQDLTVEFGNIIETPTVFPEEQGQLEITVTNQGEEDATDATLNLYASTDTELDDEVLNTSTDTIEGTDIDALQGTDELLGSIDGVNLAAGETQTFTIDFASEDFQTTSVVSPGAYNLIAEVDLEGDSNLDNNLATQFISSDGTDVVLDWNSVFLNAVQEEGQTDSELGIGLEQDSTSLDDITGVAPPVEAYNGAILHLAIHDAISNAPEGASQEAAAVGAAHYVLSQLFGVPQGEQEDSSNTPPERFEQQATFDAQLARSLEEIQDDPAAEDAGFDFGTEVAQNIIAERSNDGAAQAQVPYEPGTAPGDYQETREDGPVVALLPNWGFVTPFAIDSPVSFRPEGPPAFSSPSYAEDVEEVRRLGAIVDTDITDVERTEEQTEIAQFWAYDREDTFRPPGQWNQIAQEIAIDEGNSLEENAQLFAELNVSLADAGIVAWDTKYAFEQIRPINAIGNADNDNNPDTVGDPEWEPLLDTPNFPDYISGHSAFGGAAAGVLQDFFGEDVSFEIATQELPGVTREFTSSGSTSSFEVAARENADSRLFGGVHVDISNVDGVDVGLDVASSVLDSDLFI